MRTAEDVGPYEETHNFVGTGVPDGPKTNEFSCIKNQPVGESLGAPENKRLSFARTGDL